MMKYQKEPRTGFTLIELMITVAIVAVLAAIAIPSYISYIRRSYLNEVNAAFAAIKNAEESFFTNNGCYITAEANPASIPSGGTATTWTQPGAWATAFLNVRPDRTVRFQYQVYASNLFAATGCGAAQAKTTIGTAYPALGCVSNVLQLIPDTIFPTNWYVVVARGDLSPGGVTSNIISAIDDSTVIMCNELE